VVCIRQVKVTNSQHHSVAVFPVLHWSLPCYCMATSAADAHLRPPQGTSSGRPATNTTPSPGSLPNDLIYHSGNGGFPARFVGKPPAFYLIFWGPDWANGPPPPLLPPTTPTVARIRSSTAELCHFVSEQSSAARPGPPFRTSTAPRTRGDDQLCRRWVEATINQSA